MLKNIKTILLVPDYIDSKYNWDKFISSLSAEFNIIIFQWNNLYKYQDKINLEIVENEIIKFCNNKKIDPKKTLLISKGISSIYILTNKLNELFANTIFINPYFVKSIINPFLSKVSTYKDDMISYWKKLLKQHNDISLLYKSQEDQLFISSYNEYKDNYLFFDKLTSFINDYLYINTIRKNEVNYNWNKNLVLLSKKNNILKFELLYSQIKKKTDNITIFKNSSHSLECDELRLFFKILKNN